MFERYIKIAENGQYNKLAIPDTSGDIPLSEAMMLHDVITGRHVDIALDMMEREDVLKDLIPGLGGVISMKDKKKRFKDLWWHTKKVVLQAKPKLEVRWAALFHDFGKPECFSMDHGKVTFHNHEAASVKYFKEFARKFRIFTPEQYNKICFLIYHLGYVESYESSWTESAIRRFGKEMGEHFEDVLLLSRADTTSSRPEKRAKIQHKISELKKRVLEIRAKDAIVPPLPKGIGNAIIELGIPPGRSVGNVKSFLEKKVDDGELKANQPIEYYVEFLTDKIEQAQK